MFPELTRDDVFRIETRRLWLRWPRGADMSAVVKLAGEKAVAEMTASIRHPLDPHEATLFVLRAREANAAGRELTMAVTPRREPNALIGVASIRPDPAGGRAHLGYWLGTPHWGSGLATEAARSLVDAFFAYTNGTELISSARVINPASRRVLEKCGFAATGSGLQAFPARDGVLPVDHFRLDRRKWESFERWSASDHASRPGDGAVPARQAAP